MIEFQLRPKDFASNVVSWYTADLDGPAPGMPTSATPVRVGTSAEMAAVCAAFHQYEAGVFSAVPVGVPVPEFGERFTERDDGDVLAPALVEIRAWDTTFLEIHTTDERIAGYFVDAYGVKLRRF